jgi:hypothetical protein
MLIARQWVNGAGAKDAGSKWLAGGPRRVTGRAGDAFLLRHHVRRLRSNSFVLAGHNRG